MRSTGEWEGASAIRRTLALSLAVLLVGSAVTFGGVAGSPVGAATAADGGTDNAKITSDNPSPVAPGQSFTLNASSNYSQPTYNWSLGNGETRNGTQNITASYSEPGTYDVNLTVTNESSGETASHEITIEVVALDVNASANDTSVITDEAVQFNSTVSNDTTAVDYEWTFGDGSNASAQNVTHSYDSTGTYNATVTVEDENNNTATDNVTVEVRDPGAIKFVHVDGTSDHVTFVTEDGTNIETNRSADIVGPMADLDGDDLLEAPYVDSQGDIYVVDRNDQQQFVAEGTYNAKTKLSVGDWTGDGTPEVLYANTSDNDYLYYANTSGEPTKIANKSADAVLGAVDFDNDGGQDVVYVGTSQELKYYDGANTTQTGYDQFGIQSSTSISAGAPAEFYNNGTFWVPAMDTSGQPELVNADGTVHQLNTDSADKTPVAGVNWTGDATLELLHLKSSEVKYTTLDGATSTVNDADGNSIDAVQSAGVAGVVNVSATADVYPSVDNVTVEDADGNGLASDGEEIEVAVNVSGDVDQVTADLSAFGAGEQTWSPGLDGGEETLTTTVSVDESAASEDGARTVSVTASDDDGNTDSATSDALTLDTTVGTVDAGENTTVETGETVSFDATATDENGVSSYEWFFDDGSTATGESVSHSYDDTQRYSVTLQVTDDAGNTENDTVIVTVEDTSSSSDDSSSDDSTTDDSSSDDTNNFDGGDDTSDSTESDSNDSDSTDSDSTDTESTDTDSDSSDSDATATESTVTETDSESSDSTDSDSDDSSDSDATESTSTDTDATNTDATDPTGTTSTSTPGFGVVVSVFALLGAALLVRRA